MALSGEPNKIIGRKLGISHRTVELHRSNILRKTGTANMLQLASAFGARAWLDDPLTEFGETSSQTMNALRALPS
jgi:DNA-binding NarL/FixJ family response regulator